MSCYIARYIDRYIQKKAFECNSRRYIVTLPVTFNVTAETLINTDILDCCYIVTSFFHKVLKIEKIEKTKKRVRPKTPTREDFIGKNRQCNRRCNREAPAYV